MKKKYYSKKHKDKKVKKNKINFIIYSFLIICVLSGIAYFTRYDNFEFNKINISGVEGKNEEEIKSLVQDSLLSTTSFWLISRGTPMTYDKKGIKERVLKEFPKINKVIIKSVGNNTLSVLVSERDPHYLWCTSNCYLVDILYIAYEEVSDQYTDYGILKINDNLNIVNLGSPVMKKENLDEIKKITEDITDYGYVIDSIEITSDNHYYITLDSDVILKLTSLKDISIQIDNFKAAFSEKNENLDINAYQYIDLRFDNRVYTKEKEVD